MAFRLASSPAPLGRRALRAAPHERELLRLTATVPLDDRQCPSADLEDLRLPLIRSFLKEVGSGLHARAGKTSLLELARPMNIVEEADESVKPRNVGTCSSSTIRPNSSPAPPSTWSSSRRAWAAARSFRCPSAALSTTRQVRNALRCLRNNVLREKVVKRPDRAEATRIANYPFPAVEEALVNAACHRACDQPEPVEVRVNPDGIEVVSYPGPDASIRIEALNGDKIVARRYRNRRIGEFLKELDLAEGRCTGIPTMRAAVARNGSQPPRFSTDEARTWFVVELPVHPDLPGVG